MVQERVEVESTLHQQIKATENAVIGTESTPEQSQEQSTKGRKRERSPENEMNIDEPDNNNNNMNKKKMKKQQFNEWNKQRLSIILSRFSSRSVRPLHIVVPGEGFRDSAQKLKAIKLAKNAFKKRNKDALRGEADRVIPNLKPKYLYSGKRSNGKNQRR